MAICRKHSLIAMGLFASALAPVFGIDVPLDGRGYTQLARGLQSVNGLGWGPEGEFFATENHGHWKPTNALYRIPVKGDLPTHGRFYGYRRKTNNACGVAAL